MAAREARAAEAPARDGLLTGLAILIAMPQGADRDGLSHRVRAAGGRAIIAEAPTHALHAARAQRLDAALIGWWPSAAAADLVAALSESHAVSCCVVTPADSLDACVAAMRAGAVDAIPAQTRGDELADRLAAAGARSARVRETSQRGAARAERMKKVCRRLIASRREMVERSGELCGEMARACRELAQRVDDAALASEVGTLFRQELDLESLLRTALEYALKKTGPTNAAIFLPSTSGDYSLGAYANFDCPRDTVESVLETLAGVIAPAYEGATSPSVLETWPKLNAALGQEAHLIDESTLAVFPCRHEGECLAVVALFRDRRTPFPDGVVRTVGTVAGLLGAQLARVIRTHHRHLPRDAWGGPGDHNIADDDIDLAA